jgi:hypothetical protein
MVIPVSLILAEFGPDRRPVPAVFDHSYDRLSSILPDTVRHGWETNRRRRIDGWRLKLMRTPVELRSDAWDCLQRAEQAQGRRDKAILLLLAQGWASLADEMERLGTVKSALDHAADAPALGDPHEADRQAAGAN